MKPYFDAIIIVPLEEEFEHVLANFNFVEDLSSDRQIMFSVSIPGRPLEFLLAKQSKPGRTGTQEATLNCLEAFDAGVLVCVGIAGGLSSDVAIGDICYTGSVIDVLDNAKATDTADAGHNITLSPTTYSSPREITISIALDRLNPITKGDHGPGRRIGRKTVNFSFPASFPVNKAKRNGLLNPARGRGQSRADSFLRALNTTVN